MRGVGEIEDLGQVADSTLGLIRSEDVASFREMLQRISDGRTVLFVGAGPSTPLFGSWNALISSLLAEARLVSRKETPFETVDRCRLVLERLDRTRYGEVLIRCFRGDRRSRFEEVHTSMAFSHFDAYVTTNYDRCLEAACEASQRPLGEVFSYPGIISAANVGRRSLFHLHGLIPDDADTGRPPELILGERDYERAYRRDEDIPQFLDQLLVRSGRAVVFCGYSFQDHNAVLESLRRSAARIRERAEGDSGFNSSPRRHYVLLSIPTFENLAYWRQNVLERTAQLADVVKDCEPVAEFVPVFYADPNPDDKNQCHRFLRVIFAEIANVRPRAERGPEVDEEYHRAVAD